MKANLSRRFYDYLSSIASNYVLMGLGIVSGMLLARLLQPEARGEFAIYSYFQTLIVSMIPFAAAGAFGRIVGKYKRSGRRIVPAGFQIMAAGNLVITLVIAAITPLLLSSQESVLRGNVIICCLLSCGTAYNTVMVAWLRNSGKISWVNGALVTMSGATIMIYLAAYGLNWHNPLWIFLLLQGVNGLLFLVYAIKLRINLLRPCSAKCYAICGKNLWPFCLPSFILAVYGFWGNFLLVRLTDNQAVGYFSVAFSVGVGIMAFALAFIQLGYVEVANAANREQVRHIIVSRINALQIIMVVVMLVAWPLLRPVIGLIYGSAYLPAATVAILLLPAICLENVVVAIDYMLQALKRPHPGMMIRIFMILLVTLAAFPLCHRYGVLGFCLALIVGRTISLVIFLAFFCKMMDLPLRSFWAFTPTHIRQLVGTLWYFGKSVH